MCRWGLSTSGGSARPRGRWSRWPRPRESASAVTSQAVSSGRDRSAAPGGSRAYLVDARGVDLPDLTSLVHLLETFCSGAEGSTLGYEEAGGVYRPILEAATNEIALRWGLVHYQNAVARFVEAACENLRLAEEVVDTAALGAVKFPLRQNIGALWNDPSGQEPRPGVRFRSRPTADGWSPSPPCRAGTLFAST